MLIIGHRHLATYVGGKIFVRNVRVREKKGRVSPRSWMRLLCAIEHFHPLRVIKGVIILLHHGKTYSKISKCLLNKIKHFRLCLSYDVSSESPKRDLRETWTRKMKIESSRQTRTEHCDSLSSWRSQKCFIEDKSYFRNQCNVLTGKIHFK